MKGQLSQTKLEAFLFDIRDEPSWRGSANREAAYYDGKQLDGNTLVEMEERGIAPLIRNLIGPTIDVVLGMEAKNKRDWKVIAELDSDTKIAEGMNVRLKQAERVCEADMACSDAYASQIKVGVGWVEVARESDPFLSRYRCQNIHRNEIWWDWRAKRRDLMDARYLARKRWLDEDILLLAFPNKAQVVRNALDKWADWEDMSTDSVNTPDDLFTSYETESNTRLSDEEWRDSERRRLALHEIWYRVYDQAVVFRLSDDTVIEYDPDNLRHQTAAAEGMARLESALVSRVRLSWWIGPHRLADIPTPYPHNRFPYVPFWGYREDSTGIPYGLIRRMMSPQDEINARLAKMMWLLSAKRVIADDDAFSMPHKQVMDEVGRPDTFLLTNPVRKNRTADAIRIESDFQLSQQQFQVLQDATMSINNASGVYQSMLGKDVAGVESGIAINSLVEQGATTLAEINDNYRYARKHVGELLLSLVREDIGSQETPVEIEFNGQRQTLVMNQMTVDEDGFPYRSNDIVRTRMRVELDDVPNTATYRAQQLQNLTEITKSLPPELQTLIVDLIVRATDLEQRHEIADRLAKATGQKQQDLSPEEEQQQQQQAQKQAEAEQLALEEAKAKVRKLEAEANYYEARTDKTQIEGDKIEQDMTLGIDEHGMAREGHAVDVMERLNAQQNPSGDAKPSKPKQSAA